MFGRQIHHPQPRRLVQPERQARLHPFVVYVPVVLERLLEQSAQIESESVDLGVDPVGDLPEPNRQVCTIIAMSQALHAPAGYSSCRTCGEWVRDEVFTRTDGLCPAHFAAAGRQRLTSLELVGRGMVLEIPKAKGRRRTTKRGTPERKARKRLAELAKRRARHRLAAIFPEIYDILLAEERGELGLEPWPTAIALRGGNGDDELAFAALARELSDRKVSV